MKQAFTLEVQSGLRAGQTFVVVEAPLAVGTLRYAVEVRGLRAGNPLQEAVNEDRAKRDAAREALTHLLMDPRFPV
ncbi:hypothetical protein D3C87_1560460 [compost metagenome]